MTTAELSSIYRQRANAFAADLKNISGKINNISNARLFTVLVFLAAGYWGLTHIPVLYGLPLLVILFIFLVRVHGKLYEKKTHLENLVAINERELRLLQGDTNGLDEGRQFIDSHHAYSHDLDIFGEGSLYQHVNRANTLAGRKKLAGRLAGLLNDTNEIAQQQESIRELSAKLEFRQHFQAAGMATEELPHDREQLLQWLKHPSFVYGKKLYAFLLIIVPALTLLLVALSFISVSFRPFAILLAAFQWAFLGFHMKKISAFHEYVSHKRNTLEKYARLLHHLQSETFTSARMKHLALRAQNAGKKTQQLATLVRALDARLNSMTMLVMNSLLLYDLQCVYRLERWKEENAEALTQWLDAVDETEVIASFGTFAFNHPGFHYASVNDALTLSAKGLGHPLIPETECVTNDFYLDRNKNVMIITGANMAGKSTFLRTVGISVVLALNGAPVFASEFRCPLLHLRTGMRTADSLKDHQSYFYAELDRLKGIMEELRRDIPLLILLDEILKGTNSTDKQAGSIALVRQLLPHPCLAMIATHDLALGTLERDYPGQVRNFCFEASIENDQLFFDYKLKAGLAQKMNATFLMKKMGIIPA